MRGPQTVTDSNLALHEDGFTADDAGTGITREMTQNLRGDNSPTVQAATARTSKRPRSSSRPVRQDNPTVRQKVETAMRQGGTRRADRRARHRRSRARSHCARHHGPAGPRLHAGSAHAGGRPRRALAPHHGRGRAPRRSRDMDATAIASTGAWNLNGEDLDPTMPPQSVRRLEQRRRFARPRVWPRLKDERPRLRLQ